MAHFEHFTRGDCTGMTQHVERKKDKNGNYLKYKNDLVSIILGPHAPYTCDPEYLKIVTETAKEHNLPLTIHLSESEKEIEDIKDYILKQM